MDIREYNRNVFEDTLNIINSSKDLLQSTFESIKRQEFIPEGFEQDVPLNFKDDCIVKISKNRTMEAAKNYAGRKVTVLNFASATTPGGGVKKGSSAQEECLCRVSNLYLCLSDNSVWDKYYQKNRDAKDNVHTDDIIYTPNVIVLKDDDYNTFLEKDRFTVDVITCAAPNLRDVPYNSFNKDSGEPVNLSDDELYKVHVKRAKQIMTVAADKDTEVLILGAFGCGAFRNNPYVVAKAYKDAIQEFRKSFKEIEFAVYCSPKDDTNYKAFVETMLHINTGVENEKENIE